MESSACYFGTQRTLFCLTLFKFARFSLQTDGIATDVFWVQIYTFFVLATKMPIFAAKQRHCFHAAKVRGKMIKGLVLFGTCFWKIGLDLFEEGIGFNFHSAEGKPFLTQVLQGCTKVINGVVNAKETVVGVLELVYCNGLILRVMAL